MISIIIPTYNRFEIVQETILKTIAIDNAIEFEVIVVNDGEDFPFDLNHPKLSILKNPKRGAASARNYGATKAKYDLLFFIDDDMWITSDSLSAIKELNGSGFLANNCAVLNWKYPETLIQDMVNSKIGRYLLNAKFYSLEGRLNQQIDTNNPLQQITVIGSGSFIISREIFYKAGGYNEAYFFAGEDNDFSERLQKANTGLYIYTGITCYHNQKDRNTIESFLNREFTGYLSLFSNKNSSLQSGKLKQLLYSVLIPFKSLFIFIFNLCPNLIVFDFITFRTIGILSSITYFRAWYKADKKKLEN